MTMETWVRFDSVPLTGRAGLIDNDGQYSLVYFSTTGLRCSNGLDDLPHIPVSEDVWFHVACTWDGATLTMYFDGMPVTSMPSTGTISTTNTDGASLLDASPLWDEPLDGAMDNVRIWHSERTQAQICADAGLAGCVEDFDAIAAGVDNCPSTFNIDQYDTDGDGTGDACDTSPTVASTGAFTDLRVAIISGTARPRLPAKRRACKSRESRRRDLTRGPHHCE